MYKEKKKMQESNQKPNQLASFKKQVSRDAHRNNHWKQWAFASLRYVNSFLFLSTKGQI